MLNIRFEKIELLCKIRVRDQSNSSLIMNFKMQIKQNQLIERISSNHLIVGIDIAQQFHVARAVNYRRIMDGDPHIRK